jgi:hypothetical protein
MANVRWYQRPHCLCNAQVCVVAQIVGKTEPAGSGLPFAPFGETFRPLVQLKRASDLAIGGAELPPRRGDDAADGRR